MSLQVPAVSSQALLTSRRSASVFGRPVAVRAPTHETGRKCLQVVCGKGKGKKRFRTGGAGQQKMQQMPPTPPVDPNDEEFVLFVRSKKVPKWYPYSIMKGGWAANALVKSQENDWGKKLYSGTLVKNVSEALYKDYDKVVQSVRQNYPMLKEAKELQFGFKVRDKTKPDEWWKPLDVQELLPQEEVGKNVVDSVVDNVKGMFSGGK
ncbi:hypothetical protein BSKO_01079 [Bryopsis sp. KO-2023]|nr:hypothetical protein BSKO_01079 [Bryopsis sp. KO-2023]